jgi:hypothetical protein
MDTYEMLDRAYDELTDSEKQQVTSPQDKVKPKVTVYFDPFVDEAFYCPWGCCLYVSKERFTIVI